MIRLVAAVCLLVLPATAAAQGGKVYRIGHLIQTPTAVAAPYTQVFYQRLRELRYGEGQNVVLEVRSAEGRIERLPALAEELVRLKVDVIVVALSAAALAAKKATTTIPIVMAGVVDPVGLGLVQSLARPGGNVTGLSFEVSPAMAGKQLQLLKEAVPSLTRVAILWNPDFPGMQPYRKETEAAAGVLGLKLHDVYIRKPTEVNSALAGLMKERPDGLYVPGDPATFQERKRVLEFAARNRLPAMYGLREFVDEGGLMFYGPSFRDAFRRAAEYVDRILKGTRPENLPVEQPTKFHVVVNLKTAKALGLTLPQSILIRADEVIQ